MANRGIPAVQWNTRDYQLKAKLDVLNGLPVILKTTNYLLDWRRQGGGPQIDLDVPLWFA